MSRRGENIYKRKDGRWEARILKSDGKYQYVYAKTYKEVREKKKTYQERIKIEGVEFSYKATNAAEMFQCWLRGDILTRVKASTYESYYNCIQCYVIPFFQKKENKYLTELTASFFVKCIHDNTMLSESYKRKLISIFKTALKDILKGQAGGTTIIDAVSLPKVGNSEIQAFSMKEQRLIENALFDAGDIHSFGILLAFYTGIRLGELCALRWCDFDMDAGTMFITKTVTRVKNLKPEGSKTILLVGPPKSQKAIRKIPLPAFFTKLYQEFKTYGIDENSYLFSGTSTPIDPRTFQKLFKKVLEDVGVKYRKFHAIRHTFATRALELGVDIKTLSEILGHSNVSITLNIYAHSLMEQKKLVMDKFNNLYATHKLAVSFTVTDTVKNS